MRTHGTGIVRCVWRLALWLLAIMPTSTRALTLEVALDRVAVPASAASDVTVQVTLANPGDEVLYLNSVSASLPECFVSQDPFAEFMQMAPDSLAPGESWVGPLLRLSFVPGGPAPATTSIGVSIGGGEHRWAREPLAELVIPVSDSLATLDAPGPRAEPGREFACSPNPFGGVALVSFDVPVRDKVRLSVLDLQGRQVRMLAEGTYEHGRSSVVWDGRDQAGRPVAPGVHWLRLQTGRSTRYLRVVSVR